MRSTWLSSVTATAIAVMALTVVFPTAAEAPSGALIDSRPRPAALPRPVAVPSAPWAASVPEVPSPTTTPLEANPAPGSEDIWSPPGFDWDSASLLDRAKAVAAFAGVDPDVVTLDDAGACPPISMACYLFDYQLNVTLRATDVPAAALLSTVIHEAQHLADHQRGFVRVVDGAVTDATVCELEQRATKAATAGLEQLGVTMPDGWASKSAELAC